MNEELIFVFNYLNEVKEKINPLKEEGAGTFICMVAEEYCKANGKDVIQFFADLLEGVKEINKEFGKY